MCLGGSISESADLDTVIKRSHRRRLGECQKIQVPFVRPMERLITTQDQRIHSAEGVETMLYGCATWIMRSQDFDSMRIAHHKLCLHVVGFQRSTVPDTNPYRVERLSRGPVPANLGSPGSLFDKATQGFLKE